MEIKELIEIGEITKIHGIKGGLFVKLGQGVKSSILDQKSEHLWLKMGDAKFNQHSINEVKKMNAGIVLMLKGICDPDTAQGLRGAKVFLRATDLAKSDDEIWLFQLLNFEVYDQTGERVGKVFGFETNDFQDRMVIRDGEIEFTVPIVKSLLTTIDIKNKRLTMRIPSGLRELNLKTGNDLERFENEI